MIASNDKRKNMFRVVCIPLRIAIAVFAWRAAKTQNVAVRRIAGSLLALMALGFAVQFARNPKHGAFGQQVWWQNSRPVHALLLAVAGFAILLPLLSPMHSHTQRHPAAYVLAPLMLSAVGGLAFRETHYHS